MKKILVVLLSLTLCNNGLFADNPPHTHLSIIGGGIVGSLETYYAYKDALNNGTKIRITVYEKQLSFYRATEENTSSNTSYNIVPSLTIDEILSVVPRGNQLMEKLSILFSEPGGIRVDDVTGVNDSESSTRFKEAVSAYGSDINHNDRTITLLTLGRKSMELWQQLYDEGDDELKTILIESNFNPCREPVMGDKKILRDGYRVDLIYGIPNALQHVSKMKADYEKLGYAYCAVLSPDDVVAIDPFLADFCRDYSELGPNQVRIWKSDCAALWRPGGCIDTTLFLPKFYDYLYKIIGKDNFELKLGCEVTGVVFDHNSNSLRIVGIEFSDGSKVTQNEQEIDYRYVFCPGEAVGTLHKLGFNEPAYAGFAVPCS